MKCDVWQSSGQVELPKPRPDGVCCECNGAVAVTRDGRFCRRCLKSLVKQLSPGETRNYRQVPTRQHLIDTGHYGADAAYHGGGMGGWHDNAIRAMEGD
jgi:predicted amidophosphoribosyltransferase